MVKHDITDSGKKQDYAGNVLHICQIHMLKIQPLLPMFSHFQYKDKLKLKLSQCR
jgi:hypothetical protein